MIRKIATAGLLLLLAGCARPQTGAAPTAAPPPARLQPEPEGVTGLAPAALRARFGAPAFSRKDGATEMWRYDGASCHVFFFLTGDKVSHVETIPRPADAAADPACLNALRKVS